MWDTDFGLARNLLARRGRIQCVGDAEVFAGQSVLKLVFLAKMTSCGCGYDKNTLMSHPHVIDNVHLDTWRTPAKILLGRSLN